MEKTPYGKYTKEFRLEEVGKGHRELSEKEMELHRLKRELADHGIQAGDTERDKKQFRRLQST